jgi:oligopeptide transport system ATP-binding protein
MNTPLLTVADLSVEFHTDEGIVKAVSNMSWDLAAGETMAILGESGSGKSVSVQAVMGLLPMPPAVIAGGSIRYGDTELIGAAPSVLRKIRGPEIAMIFQDPLSALNPVYRVGWQIAEMFRMHEGASRSEARTRSIDLMVRVGIPNPEIRFRQYPHEFSGGMRQRAMIAMALALNPKVLIADEPTTALDVTVQAQIMELLGQIQADTDMGLILITHDLGVVASVADRVVVMYAGRAVETGDAESFYRRPAHPYSQGLMRSVPRLTGPLERLHSIDGTPPSVVDLPPGCAFAPRCPEVHDRCTERPVLVQIGERERQAACHLVGEQVGETV